ncbi:cytochrome P450 [Guyanagaster necrorhizus]|uniref:Cytochrome P450 n=1 Tax=Guyanagaster necrorhizus TaxID=856835 RepID=A0A9P7VYE7_9AGAR|nr:cytochrome P450 [Guyanagaster necrorhizus MCA 3950]KAG7448514.1 cytochrome P450 [Guyanagaster necrorhizus MCA 3950]
MAVILAWSLLCVALVLALYRRRTRRASLTNLPGPEPESFLLGNLRQFYQGQAGEADFKWQASFGHMLSIRGVLGENCLFVSDPKALQHIYHSGYVFRKHVIRKELTRLVAGKGIIWADTDDHKRQRRVILPAFGASETKALLPYFSEFAALLVSKWKEIIGVGSSATLDMPSWMSRTTLDVIGQAAFDYQFHALEDKDSLLRQAFVKVAGETFGRPSKKAIFIQNILQYAPTPLIVYLFGHASAFEQARETTRLAQQVSRDLIDTKSEAFMQGAGGRDVMSLLVKANLKEKNSQGLTDEEMLAAMQTIMGAGHETTATTLTWTLYELAKSPDLQAKLRHEVKDMEKAIGGADFSAANFESMPYLQAVMKEALRMHPVSYYGLREAARDDVIPLSKPIMLRDGSVVKEVPVAKGTTVYISIAGYNRNEDVFGKDVHRFKPERWLDEAVPRKGATAVGVYGNMMTFGSGVRSCGYFYRLLEYQTILVQLMKNFEFSVDASIVNKIRRDAALVMQPIIEGEYEKGPQLPLRVSLVSTD